MTYFPETNSSLPKGIGDERIGEGGAERIAPETNSSLPKGIGDSLGFITTLLPVGQETNSSLPKGIGDIWRAMPQSWPFRKLIAPCRKALVTLEKALTRAP